MLLSAYYQWGSGPSTSCAHPVPPANLPGRSSSLCLRVELAVLGADGQDWVFLSLFPSFLSQSSYCLFLFQGLLLYLSALLSLHISVSFWLHPCLTTSLGCSATWLFLCFSLSLSLSFPLFSPLYLSHHFFVLVCLAGPVLVVWPSLFNCLPEPAPPA